MYTVTTTWCNINQVYVQHATFPGSTIFRFVQFGINVKKGSTAVLAASKNPIRKLLFIRLYSLLENVEYSHEYDGVKVCVFLCE